LSLEAPLQWQIVFVSDNDSDYTFLGTLGFAAANSIFICCLADQGTKVSTTTVAFWCVFATNVNNA